MAKEMTKERQERLSNRLVLNFGILLGVALVMLYVNNALRSSGIRTATYTVLLILGIIFALLAIGFYFVGKYKAPKIKKYSPLCLGGFIICAMLYVSSLSLIPGYSNIKAVIVVYIAMAVYFIVLAIVTSIQLKKPVVKEKAAIDGAKNAKKKNKRK